MTVDGNKFIHKSTAKVDQRERGQTKINIKNIIMKVEGVTGHTVITEFCGDKVTRWVFMMLVGMTTIRMDEQIISPGR